MPLRPLLLLGDLLALLAFVLIGQSDHDITPTVGGVAMLVGEFALPWLIAGALLGAFPTAEQFAPRSFLARSLNTWLVAGPLGIILRTLVLGRAVVPTGFLLAALGFGGLFVLGWRLMFAAVWQWRLKKAPAQLQ